MPSRQGKTVLFRQCYTSVFESSFCLFLFFVSEELLIEDKSRLTDTSLSPLCPTDNKRVVQYIYHSGRNQVPSIRAHNHPERTCRLDTGYLKRFDRGAVCGIRSAATNRDQLPGFIAQSQQTRRCRHPRKATWVFISFFFYITVSQSSFL